MRRAAARALALLIATMAAAALGVAGFALLHRDAAAPGPAAAILVLSGGAQTTPPRVARALALHAEGAAPLLAMTGAGSAGATAMAAQARAAGVPEGAILIEARATSTLQNALHLREVLAGALGDEALAADYLLVTHRTHLPRAWASFRWAGFRGALVPVAADPPPAPGALVSDAAFWAETVKWPGNALRAALASGAELLGAPLPVGLLQ